MKKLLTLFMLTSLFFLGSCTNDEELVPESKDSTSSLLSLNEIISRADHYYTMIHGGTRADVPRIGNVKMLSKVTRSEEDDLPVYYLVNYEDNAGFAIVGANEVSKPLLAVSDECNLTSQDIDEIPGLNDFINGSLGITLPPSPIDTLEPFIPPVLNISIYPKLSSSIRKWGPDAPFNNYTPVFGGKHAATGSGPLACAMMMTYYEWPDTHNGSKINWKKFKLGQNYDELAQVLAELGNSDNLQMIYTSTETSEIPGRIRHTFGNFDYAYFNKVITLSDFHFEATLECQTETDKKLPLLISGKYTKFEPNLYDEWVPITRNYTWVIDGLLHIPHDPNNLIEPNPLPDAYYLHCVWGSYGRGNGYYAIEGMNIGLNRHSQNNSDGTYPGYTDEENYNLYTNTSGYYGFTKINNGGIVPVDPFPLL